jgi:peptidoglycan/LPS O-acetylase OafA/YrhL
LSAAERKVLVEQASGVVYRSDIDGLRAVAILPVILYHAFPSLMPGGFVGVDIFFVISGFLISGIILKALQRDRFSYADFYARRVRRIFPALTLVLASVLAVGWIFVLPNDYQMLGRHVAAGAAFVSNFALWRESGYFDAPELKPLLHLWSLGIEEQYYIIWPLLLAFLWKRTRCLAPAIVGMAVASFILNVWLVGKDSVTDFYLPFTRFWELLIGSLLAYFNLSRGTPDGKRLSAMPRWGREALSIAGAILLVLAFGLLNEGRDFPGWWALLPTAGTAFLIAAGPKAWLNRKVLSHSWMILVGMISYPLYLWHWPLITFHNILGLEWSANQIRLLKLTAIAVTFGLAYVTYRWVEIPIRRGTGFRFVPQLGAAVAVILVAGVVIAAQNGVNNRFETAREQVAQFASDYPDHEVGKAARVRTCFLEPDQRVKDFAPECLGNVSGGPSPKAVLIWGDSHAAHLYYGLRVALAGTNTPLWQLTASSCPPVLEHESTQRSGCAKINGYVLEKVRQLRPGTVVLDAFWWRPPFVHFSRVDLLEELHKSIVALKNAGVARVVVVGPVPVFKTPQPKLIALAMVGKQMPSRLRPADLASQRSLDADLKEVSTLSGARYASPLSVECDTADCLVALTNQIDGIMAYDYGHLTERGSEFVARTLLLPELESSDKSNDMSRSQTR